MNSDQKAVDGYRQFKHVVVPVRIAEALLREEEEALQKEESRLEEERIRRDQRDLEARDRAEADRAASRLVSRLKTENPFQDLDGLSVGPPPENHRQIFDFEQLARLGEQTSARYVDKMDINRLKALADHLAVTGPYRKLAPLRSDYRLVLNRLAQEMPNFRQAVDALASSLAWSAVTDKEPRFPPLLLLGPPGVGKTLFSERLAELFETRLVRVDMSTSSNGARLAGSASNWGNTRPGEVFDALTFGQVANPLFLLDEIEKGAKPREYVHPTAALFSLWEEFSASRFQDASFPGIHLDASRVMWIATANSLSTIDEPLLSRMMIISVSGLPPAQAVSVCERVYAELCTKFSKATGNEKLFKPLSDGLLSHLAQHSPRVMKRHLTMAMGRALHHGRLEILAEDLSSAVSMNDDAERAASKRTSMDDERTGEGRS